MRPSAFIGGWIVGQPEPPSAAICVHRRMDRRATGASICGHLRSSADGSSGNRSLHLRPSAFIGGWIVGQPEPPSAAICVHRRMDRRATGASICGHLRSSADGSSGNRSLHLRPSAFIGGWIVGQPEPPSAAICVHRRMDRRATGASICGHLRSSADHRLYRPSLARGLVSADENFLCDGGQVASVLVEDGACG